LWDANVLRGFNQGLRRISPQAERYVRGRMVVDIAMLDGYKLGFAISEASKNKLYLNEDQVPCDRESWVNYGKLSKKVTNKTY